MNALVVFRKELVDALRDRRTLLMVLLSSVAIGPVVLIALSALVAGIEKRAEERSVIVAGIEHAPTLRNYLELSGLSMHIAIDSDGTVTVKDMQQVGTPIAAVAPA